MRNVCRVDIFYFDCFWKDFLRYFGGVFFLSFRGCSGSIDSFSNYSVIWILRGYRYFLNLCYKDGSVWLAMVRRIFV